jgi:hypothetical protein
VGEDEPTIGGDETTERLGDGLAKGEDEATTAGELGFGAAGDDAGGAAGEAGDFGGGTAAEVGMVGRKERKRDGGYSSKIRMKRGAGVRMSSVRQCQTKGECQGHGTASFQAPSPRKDVGLRPTSTKIRSWGRDAGSFPSIAKWKEKPEKFQSIVVPPGPLDLGIGGQ